MMRRYHKSKAERAMHDRGSSGVLGRCWCQQFGPFEELSCEKSMRKYGVARGRLHLWNPSRLVSRKTI